MLASHRARLARATNCLPASDALRENVGENADAGGTCDAVAFTTLPAPLHPPRFQRFWYGLHRPASLTVGERLQAENVGAKQISA